MEECNYCLTMNPGSVHIHHMDGNDDGDDRGNDSQSVFLVSAFDINGGTPMVWAGI